MGNAKKPWEQKFDKIVEEELAKDPRIKIDEKGDIEIPIDHPNLHIYDPTKDYEDVASVKTTTNLKKSGKLKLLLLRIFSKSKYDEALDTNGKIKRLESMMKEQSDYLDKSFENLVNKRQISEKKNSFFENHDKWFSEIDAIIKGKKKGKEK